MKFRGAVLLAAALSCIHSSRVRDRGLNLPPTQGTTRDGAFFPGLYQYEYRPDQVRQTLHRAGFSALRLAVNLETAMDLKALQRHKAYIDAMGGRGVICMFDTSLAANTSWPRSGRVTGKIEAAAKAWRSVHSVFASYGDSVMYELFNEPWGYNSDAAAYVGDMTSVIRLAGLPPARCILAGLYGSADVQAVARMGWTGYLAYHCYSFWLPEGQRTRQRFSEKIQQDLAGLSERIFITEFGVGLDGLQADVDADELQQDIVLHSDQKTSTDDWLAERPESNTALWDICEQHPRSEWCRGMVFRGGSFVQSPNLGADVAAKLGGGGGGGGSIDAEALAIHESETMAFLGGLRDALQIFKRQDRGIRGLYHWHGWHNGDTWDFWDAANARSSHMIQLLMADLGESDVATGDGDYFLSKDYTVDEQFVNMVTARNLSPKSAAACPAECSSQTCQPGNPAEIGGKHLTGSVCTHNCSRPFAGVRYCGAGAPYQGRDVVECGACARPAMCAGLPCWSDKGALLGQKRRSALLGQKRRSGKVAGSPRARSPSFLQKRAASA